MTEQYPDTTDLNQDPSEQGSAGEETPHYYRIRFREKGQEFTAESRISHLARGEVVIIRTDNGPEPAKIICRAPDVHDPDMQRRTSYVALRRANREEEEKYARLPELEQEAYAKCQEQIAKLDLPMQLVRVERFFNGSKIIFYFTAESRVDFRELVKNLVQEFRTRVEMRQIGVRHETQIIGGIGACGRELCCSSFLKKFESVSIKMAKTQDLPLNPTKISGLCNRLLCCLTYEYDCYRKIKKQMPRIGRIIEYEGSIFKVIRQLVLQESILVINQEGEEVVLKEKQWRAAKPADHKPTGDKTASS
ncbi:MAG: regulatory iron-sulfur-containing complex subunit RicT [Desulfobulbaceae bacterium]|nr:regulatory iron-sulfur-containing complex subunit RicT [Desulfobulbaceae bacterium]